GSASALSIPDITASGAGVGFFLQGSAFPIRQLAFNPVSMQIRKLGLGCVITRELYEHASAEVLLTAVLRADLSLGAETILFDATAASTTRPAGLKNSIAATTADAGAGETAMVNDLANLAAVVSAVS